MEITPSTEFTKPTIEDIDTSSFSKENLLKWDYDFLSDAESPSR
jgi:hypothetical protein